MASRVSQVEQSTLLTPIATTARVSQVEQSILSEPPATSTVARVSQVELSVLVLNTPATLSIFPPLYTAPFAVFPPVSVSLVAPSLTNPPGTGGPVSTPNTELQRQQLRAERAAIVASILSQRATVQSITQQIQANKALIQSLPPGAERQALRQANQNLKTERAEIRADIAVLVASRQAVKAALQAIKAVLNAQTSTPSTPPPALVGAPPASIGPGGDQGIGGSGIGPGVGLTDGMGVISWPGETNPPPPGPEWFPKPPGDPQTPPLQIIPKSALPADLDRTPMPTGLPPNQYDRALMAEMRTVQAWLSGRGRELLGVNRGLSGLGGLGAPTQAGWNQTRSLDTYRRGSRGLEREFFERGSVVTPGPGVDVVVVDWTVPVGYEARIYAYYCIYTGTGFVQGSGDILWGLRAGLNWVRNMGGLLYAVGSLANPFPVQDYVAARASQRVVFQVNVPNLSGLIQVGTSRILCGVQGWLYPITRRVDEKTGRG